jgi:PAS domain S-box-containing protein
LLKTGALQTAILTSANFSIIATDEEGIIQLFNVGAERMLGYKAAEVVNRIRPSDIHDPEEVMARARKLIPRARHRHRAPDSRRWPSRPRAKSKTSTS